MGTWGRRFGVVLVGGFFGASVIVAACTSTPAPSDGGKGGGGAGATGGSTGTGSSSASGGSTNVEKCPEATGDGTIHDTYAIDADETWTAEDGPHYVTTSLSIVGATVTIEKCAVVILSENVQIDVGDSSGTEGSLVARGVVDAGHDQPVLFKAESDEVYWGKLWVDVTGFLDLEGTVLERGGSVDTSNQNGTVVVYSMPEPPLSKRFRAVNTTIRQGAGIGVALGSFSGFSDDSENLVIEDVGREEPAFAAADTRYPILTTPAGLSTIPSGKYTENHYDAILVDGGDRYASDVSIKDRGVPYDFVDNLHIEPDTTSPITLEIEAGATLRFPKGYDATSSARFGIYLGSGTGTAEDIANPRPVKLLAEGTSTKPITFTSKEATPAAGDWIGVIWGGAPSSGNVMSYVTIEYAGADSLNNGFGCSGPDTNGALVVRTWRPSEAFIENSTFSHSLADGIICGWDSTSDGPDLTGSNTFVDIARCEVTQPQVDGACPDEANLPNCY